MDIYLIQIHFVKVDISASSVALQSIFDASSSTFEHGWEIGWSLSSRRSFGDAFKLEVGLSSFVDISNCLKSILLFRVIKHNGNIQFPLDIKICYPRIRS